MASLSASPRLAPFPPMAPALVQAFEARDLRLRRFGTTADDFTIDLDATLPDAITSILAHCTEPRPPERFFWALDVGVRIAALLQLASLDGGDELAANVRC